MDPMDSKAIFGLLGVTPRGLWIAQARIIAWGSKLTLDCLYDPDALCPFDLTFNNCHKITWEAFGDVDELEQMADVVGIYLGTAEYKQPAIIHTTTFEIVVSYASFLIEKQW